MKDNFFLLIASIVSVIAMILIVIIVTSVYDIKMQRKDRYIQMLEEVIINDHKNDSIKPQRYYPHFGGDEKAPKHFSNQNKPFKTPHYE